jgi:2-polyprenyl-6-methoxyphenol hydroxylase-like FAD-dependent oxidoreductase
MNAKHAIIMGASISGLLTARVLSGHFERVTLLERDTMPESAQGRKGVSQGAHAHGLLGRGREILEGFFPGLTKDLVAQGVCSQDIQRHVRWYIDGVALAQGSSGLYGLAVSRPLLESYIRQRVLDLPNVFMLENCTISEVRHESETVTGVRFLNRTTQQHELLTADLLVDCTGRGSQTPQWLETHGYQKPPEECVHVGIGYASAHFERHPDELNSISGVIVGRSLKNPRGAAMIAQEDDRWILSLGGWLGDQPPTNFEGFRAFANTLPAPEIRQVVTKNRLLGEIVPYHYPASRRWHYQRLAHFPKGFLVLGDAMCSFNPIYGQGMTSAALQALVLQLELKKSKENLAKRFFNSASKIVDIPWQMAVGKDLTNPNIQGERSHKMRLTNAYMNHLIPVAWHDPEVAKAFVQVTNLVNAPTSLMAPGILWRILQHKIFFHSKPNSQHIKIGDSTT